MQSERPGAALTPGEQFPTSESHRRGERWRSNVRWQWWQRAGALLLVVATVAGVAVSAAIGRIRDIDLYWHLIIGDQIRAGVPVRSAGSGWTFAPDLPDHWVSSQWLAEVVLSYLHDLGGFRALVLYRVATVVVALAVTAAVTLRGHPLPAAVVPFVLAGVALASTTQERSQQLTYVLAPLVGWWALRLLRQGRLPRWWLLVALTVGWANYHGGWVLLPFALVLAALARVCEHGLRDRPSRWAVVLAGGCGAAAMISPLGPANAIAALTFSQAASAHIAEWAPVALWKDQGWQLGAALLVAVLCWSLGAVRPGRGELVLVLGVLAFGFLAYRNITPAVLLLAPMLAAILTRTLPPPAPPSPRPPLLRTASAIAAAAVLAAVAVALGSGQDLHAGRPLALFARIAAHPGPVTVLNTYNQAGPLLWFVGGPPHVRVGIDGRTDKYGPEYIAGYLDTLLAARPGWAPIFAGLRPDAALLYQGEGLTGVLGRERGWRAVAEQDGVVLLVPPDATGW